MKPWTFISPRTDTRFKVTPSSERREDGAAYDVLRFEGNPVIDAGACRVSICVEMMQAPGVAPTWHYNEELSSVTYEGPANVDWPKMYSHEEFHQDILTMAREISEDRRYVVARINSRLERVRRELEEVDERRRQQEADHLAAVKRLNAAKLCLQAELKTLEAAHQTWKL